MPRGLEPPLEQELVALEVAVAAVAHEREEEGELLPRVVPLGALHEVGVAHLLDLASLPARLARAVGVFLDGSRDLTEVGIELAAPAHDLLQALERFLGSLVFMKDAAQVALVARGGLGREALESLALREASRDEGLELEARERG